MVQEASRVIPVVPVTPIIQAFQLFQLSGHSGFLKIIFGFLDILVSPVIFPTVCRTLPIH
jgi:hypothetical protein